MISSTPMAATEAAMVLDAVAPFALHRRMLPTGLLRVDVLGAGSAERPAVLCGDSGGGALRLAGCEGVDADKELAAEIDRLLASFGEGDEVDRSEAHGAVAAVLHVAEQPGFGAVRVDLEVEVAAVGVFSGAADGGDLF